MAPHFLLGYTFRMPRRRNSEVGPLKSANVLKLPLSMQRGAGVRQSVDHCRLPRELNPTISGLLGLPCRLGLQELDCSLHPVQVGLVCGDPADSVVGFGACRLRFQPECRPRVGSQSVALRGAWCSEDQVFGFPSLAAPIEDDCQRHHCSSKTCHRSDRCDNSSSCFFRVRAGISERSSPRKCTGFRLGLGFRRLHIWYWNP